MATIQINRSKTGVVPGSLADGELYIDQLNNKLYWADSTGVIRSIALLLPAFAPSATTDTTNATNITSGRLAAAQGGVPSGAVMAFAMQVAPAGWMECNGAAISRTTYAALFAALGTAFGGGDGTTTFNIPDMRGRFARGWDHGAGVDAARVFGSTQADDTKPHTHTINDPGHSHVTGLVAASGGPFGVGGSNLASGIGGSSYFNIYPGTLTSTVKTLITINNNSGVETRPKNVALMYCIKT